MNASVHPLPHTDATPATSLLQRTLRSHWRLALALATLSTLLSGCAPLE